MSFYNCIIQSIFRMKTQKKTKTTQTLTEQQTLHKMKKILSEGLYSIEPSYKNLTKNHLSQLSVPGVAAVCKQIQKHPSSINSHSIRGRSVAIVTRGLMLGGNGRYFLPIMDWFVTQIKYYANIDCYPFVIRNQAPLAEIFSDLANSYCAVIFLDDEQIPKINVPSTFFVLDHLKVCQITGCQLTDAQPSSYILAHLIEEQFSGVISNLKIQSLLEKGKTRLSQVVIDEQLFSHENIVNECPIKIHQNLKGKINVVLNINNPEQFSKIKEIFTFKNLKKLVSQQQFQQCSTSKLNVIVTDGTAILGLGNIGPMPGLPVMEAKSMMFKLIGNVNMIPLCINPRSSTQATVNAILNLTHLYKAINLQDIKAPQCFSIERSLQSVDMLPVFHDDQHGTAIAALAGFINAIKLAEKQAQKCKVVINGAGAAGINIASILHDYGVKNIIICDTSGIIYKNRPENMNWIKDEISEITNTNALTGELKDAIFCADVFIGVSYKDTFKKQWISLMNQKPIIFAMANPDPEITQEEAIEGGCFIYGSGKGNKPNQITNSLAYPGIFRAINQHNLKKITNKMKIEAAEQIALIKGSQATRWQILPSSLNKNIGIRISQKLKQFS